MGSREAVNHLLTLPQARIKNLDRYEQAAMNPITRRA
jgi:hypothetical protein